ncbi:MAG: hypothetical protein ACYS0J_03320 [Planctomycetota bacterium]
MRRSWIQTGMILALVLPGGPEGAAQVLDLDAAVGPPELGLDTYAAHCVRQLEREMVGLADQLNEAGEPGGDALRASLGVRWLAVTLLDGADRRAEAGSLDFIAGFRLYRGRDELDEVLNTALDPDGSGDAAAALRRFNDRLDALSRTLPIEEDAGVDDQIGALLRPLADAVGALAPGAVVNHWVRADDIARGPGLAEPASAGIDEMLRQIEAQIDTTGITEQTADELRRIVGYLRRGAVFAEYQPAVERSCRLLTDVLDLADAAGRAGWLDERRQLYRQEIHEAVMLFGDPMTRVEAERRLRHLAAARHAIDRISTLSQSANAAAPRPGTTRPRSRAVAIDVDTLRTAFLAAAAGPADEAPGGRSMEMLVRVLDGMIAYRDMAEPQLAPELRRVWRKLDGAYAAAERAVIEELPVLVGRSDALSNPALVTVLSQHAQYLEDLGRLAKVPDWVNTVRFISPRGAGPFSGHVRKLTGWLTDPGRRPEAVRGLGEIEQQLADYYPMPFEQALRRGARPAIMATGDLHEQLAVRIDEERRQWAEAWGSDTMSVAAARMRLLHRLTRIMADAETLLDAGDSALILNRWAAWEIDPETFQRLVADLGTRLKLATTAALEVDDAALTDQLDRIQMPPAALVSRLTEALNDPLGQLPPGALSIVGQAVRRPPPDAWLLHRRGEIADVCRYEMELQYARSTGREELAAKLTAYVDMLASDLLEEISP